MADVNIITNGTIQGTKLTIDGKDETKSKKLVSISMYASAPYVSKISGDVMPGYVSVSYENMNDDGTVERKSIGSSSDNYTKGIGQKIKSKDSVVRYIGAEVEVEVETLVDKIIEHCKEKELKCPDKETLLSRSIESLRDKATDLGLTDSEENNEENNDEDGKTS